MRRAIFSLAVAAVVAMSAPGCRSSAPSATTSAEQQEQFGVRMARMNLWREAMFRFRRAVELNPEDATAHNNLAVAYEANGDFENAAKAYREAMRLDRSNQHIQKNYSRFVEFTTRDRRRQQRRPAAQAATGGETADTPQPSAPAVPAAGAPAVPSDGEAPADTTPADAPPASEPSEPKPADPAATPPGGDPSPTGSAPAETPPPNPAPAPQPPPPPGGE
jgi:hypothetical protein